LIDQEKLKNQLTKDDIINILASLGADAPKEDHKGNLIFPTICHNACNGSHKLYYYENTRLFTCYTECGESFDVFDLISRNKQLYDEKWRFENSLFYVMDATGYTANIIQNNNIIEHKIDDWDFLNRYKRLQKPKINLPVYEHYVLDIYRKYYHASWVAEGISPEAMEKFNIKFDAYNNKIIIPHYNENNELIGIRGRSLNKEDIENKRKYMPVRVENTIYSHPVSCNLYGLNHNLNTIKKMRKAFIVEGEKSVLKIESYYPNNNFSIAVCGNKISDFQKDLILQYVDEVIIGFDKSEEYMRRGNNEGIVNARKIAQRFSPYVQTFIIADKENLLDIKDAPVDKGQYILEKLMKNKIEIKTIGW